VKEDEELNQKYLFVGAHPDDIEFGAGATLAKSVLKNVDCYAIIFSDCHQSLDSKSNKKNTLVIESQRALIKLGLKPDQMRFLNFQVRKFPESRQDILQELFNLSQEHSFDRVFVPCSYDIHQDHQVVAIESLRAFKFSTVLGYELPWNNLESKLQFFNEVNEYQVQVKKEAISEFNSQYGRFYSGIDKVETILKFRGLQANKNFAEAFEVLRWIES